MPSSLFPADRLFLIAGPCQLEDDTLNLRVAETLARLAEHVPGGIIFKASFDKANRSNIDGVRGPGLEAGLAALRVGRRIPASTPGDRSALLWRDTVVAIAERVADDWWQPRVVMLGDEAAP